MRPKIPRCHIYISYSDRIYSLKYNQENVDILQSYATRWTSGTLPVDCYTHMVLKQIVFDKLGKEIIWQVRFLYLIILK